jgi:hypothetical protein
MVLSVLLYLLNIVTAEIISKIDQQVMPQNVDANLTQELAQVIYLFIF